MTAAAIEDPGLTVVDVERLAKHLQPSQRVVFSRTLPASPTKTIPQGEPFQFKPNGLWYAFGAAWAEWLLSEEPGWISHYLGPIRSYWSRTTSATGYYDHEDCGHCEYWRIRIDTARELAAKGDVTLGDWAAEVERRWHVTKYYLFWRVEQVAGRDPEASFKACGWQV